MDFGARGIGGEIKLFPPPLYQGELNKWDDWSWQLKRYVGLYQPLTKTLMDEIETNPTKIVTDGLCEAYDVQQQTQTQNNQLKEDNRKEIKRNGAKMLNGMVMNGMNMTGVRIGLVLLMIGLVTGLGPKMTGVTGPMTGLGVLRTGGVLIGSLDDWSGDWSWSEDDWSYWSDDWSWGSQDWWSAEQPNASASSGSQGTANVPQDPTKSEPSQNVAAVTVETQDQNAARPSRTVRGAKPGMMTNLFVGACLLIGPLSAGVPPVPSRNVPENDQLGCDDRLVEFHLQAGLVDKSWILFDSGACANCCPEWFAPDYPILPLNESAPSLRSLSGKTLEVQGRKIVQRDCGNGHSLSVQFYMCTGIPFPLVSVARLLLQDFWTVMAKDYLALIDPAGNPVPIVRKGTLIYLCPTVIPYAVADAARMAASCLPEVMDGIENELGSVELRGVTDMNDGSIDPLFQIGALIAAAQEVKAKEGYRWDMWEVNESNLKLIRHVRVWRNECWIQGSNWRTSRLCPSLANGQD
eukprot:s3510_g10.t1